MAEIYSTCQERSLHWRLVPLCFKYCFQAFNFYLCFFQWMNTRTLVTIDTTERIHVIDVRSEEELEVSSRIFCAHAACVTDIQIHNSHSVIHF